MDPAPKSYLSIPSKFPELSRGRQEEKEGWWLRQLWVFWANSEYRPGVWRSFYQCSVSSLEPPHAGRTQFKIHTPKHFMVVGLLLNWKIGEFSETSQWNNEHIGLMCKCRFWSVSLGKAEQFTLSSLSICFVGCDKQSPWWEKHPPVQNLPWLWNFLLSRSLVSVVCSASLQCWFGEVTQLENEHVDESVDSTAEILWSNVQQFEYYCLTVLELLW